jgi:hypothetical protein
VKILKMKIQREIQVHFLVVYTFYMSYALINEVVKLVYLVHICAIISLCHKYGQIHSYYC